jgi:hypothetical protein
LWTLQTDLLKLQQDIQRSIAKSKSTSRRSRDAQGELDALRDVRWKARRFGDAIGWLFLGLDRKVIEPLAHNSPVAIPIDDHGSQGVLATADALCNEGWGFPVLHDITDCLRIGDITFVKPGKHPNTVEVKTRLIDKRPSSDGTTTLQYEVALISAAEPSAIADVEPETAAARDPSLRHTRGRRVERQVRRMSTAHAHQVATPGVSTIDGQDTITTHVERPRDTNFAPLQRVTRRARRAGFATEAVDDTFFYATIYNRGGVDASTIPARANSLPSDLIASGILFEEEVERNSIVIYTIPTEHRGGPDVCMPFYLYDLPRSTILDILHGRMIVTIIVNSGRITEALKVAGFDVKIPSGRNDLANGSLVLAFDFEDDDGTAFRMGLHNLRVHVYEMIMEFKPLSYLVDVAKTMRSSALLAVSERQGNLPVKRKIG